MSIDLFRITHGLDIQADDFSGNVNILQGSGIPGGDSGKQDAAPRGSLFLRTDAGVNNQQLYYKWTTVNNSSADWRVVPSVDYVDAAVQGLSWREPVRVHDATLYASSAAFPVGGTVDGVPLNNGDRVLFSNVSAVGQKNVWIWDSGTSSWTEDTNAETDGDAVLVKEGTYADQQWVYDGTNWVQFGTATDTAELGYIRTFVGKTGPGAELPTYSSTDVVTQSTNLETAIGALDSAFGSGDITNTGGTWSISSDANWAATPGTNTITSFLNELNNAIGDRNYTNGLVITDGETITASLEKLNLAVGALQSQTNTFTGTNVNASGTVTIDTLPLASATEAKWMVQVRETATPANRRAVEVHAMNNGSSLVDHTTYAILALGSAVTGLNINVDINGTDMRLRLTASNNIDYVVKRIAYSAF